MKALVALAVLVATAMPATTFAGDKEWATAGKILTGVIGLKVLQGAHDRHHDSRHQREVYQSTRCRTVPTYRTTYRQSYSHGQNCACTRCRPPAPVCQPQTVIIREYVPAPAPVREPVREYVPVAPKCNTPIVSQINSTRRIFQPKIRGHVAYLQILDQGEWITLREYPSIY